MTATRATLTVSRLADRVGVSADTVRYYEKVGLLPEPKRTPAAYRIYDEADVDRMLFIQGAQRLSLSLADVKSLLDVRDTGSCPCEPAEELLRKRIDELDAEMAALAALRVTLANMVERLPVDCPAPAPGTWRPPAEEVRSMSCECCGDDSCTCCC